MVKRSKKAAVPTDQHVIRLDGTELRVRFDFLALGLFHSVTGVNVLEGLTPSALNALQVAAFAWAGCNRHHPEVEVQWFLDRLNLDNYGEIMSSLLRALMQREPNAERDGAASAAEVKIG
ncbi:MAG: hypothetical protein JWQ49_1718 [Edaphobacter sp.]|jgi:hypothetical protein|nr:hypothetical protein [Edaphobacter sp.]